MEVIREITRDEVKKMINVNVMILYSEALYSLDELWDVLSVRFLVDEDPEPKPKPKKEPAKRKNDNEQRVLEAWKGGEKTIKQVQEETGLSYATVRKYIPINENG